MVLLRAHCARNRAWKRPNAATKPVPAHNKKRKPSLDRGERINSGIPRTKKKETGRESGEKREVRPLPPPMIVISLSGCRSAAQLSLSGPLKKSDTSAVCLAKRAESA